jgi:hypothetical protein
MEDSRRIFCGFCSLGSLKDPPYAPTNLRLHESTVGCFMQVGLP